MGNSIRRTITCGLALLLTACGTSAGPAPTPTPTPSRPGPAMVQIENSVLARPLAGLQQADMGYEDPAEGGMLRRTPIHSQPTASQRTRAGAEGRPAPNNQ